MRKKENGLPDSLTDRFSRLFSPDQLVVVYESMATRRPTTLRVNTLKTTNAAFIEKINAIHAEVIQVPGFENAYILQSPDLKTFTATDIYTQGFCYVQNLSSMLPPLVLAPEPGETVLDIAAAPGSKTTQMAALMNNEGTILANDSSHIRIYKLEANLKQQGVTNVTIKKGLGQLIWQEYENHFDKTLVDAPCSMEGRIYLSDPKTFAFWSPGKVKELSHTQRFLLRAALTATKPGGILVYSTCTMSPEENEGVLTWLLEKEPDSFELLDIQLPAEIPIMPGITKWKERNYPEILSKTRRIIPNALYEGFFIAKLKKRG